MSVTLTPIDITHFADARMMVVTMAKRSGTRWRKGHTALLMTADRMLDCGHLHGSEGLADRCGNRVLDMANGRRPMPKDLVAVDIHDEDEQVTL